jgi:hypothetical protein
MIFSFWDFDTIPLNKFGDRRYCGEEGRRSVGLYLPDLRSCLPVTLVFAWLRLVSVRRGATCLVSPPSLPVWAGIFFIELFSFPN